MAGATRALSVRDAIEPARRDSPRRRAARPDRSKQGGGTVTYRAGDRAAGFRWRPGHAGLEPVKVKLIGPGKLADNVFPIAKLDPAASAKLAAAIEAEAPGFTADTIALKLDPMTGKPRWTVTGEGKVFTAGTDASSVKPVG